MSKQKKCICPTCKQDMKDAPREGYYCLYCHQCGQGLRSLLHVAEVLHRLQRAIRKAKRPEKVLATGYACDLSSDPDIFVVCEKLTCGLQKKRHCRRVEVREVPRKGAGR